MYKNDARVTVFKKSEKSWTLLCQKPVYIRHNFKRDFLENYDS